MLSADVFLTRRFERQYGDFRDMVSHRGKWIWYQAQRDLGAGHCGFSQLARIMFDGALKHGTALSLAFVDIVIVECSAWACPCCVDVC